MKLLGNLLLVVSLTVGALAAATAYLVPLDLPREELVGLTLNVDAGRDARGRPLAKKGEQLTPAVINVLRVEGDVPYVRVREFALGRWPYRWWFLAAVVGLLGSAAVLRSASRREVATAGATGAGELPEKALRAIKQTVADLRQELAGSPVEMPDLRQRYERLSDEDRTHLESFMRARSALAGRVNAGDITELQRTAGTPEGAAHAQAVRERLGPDARHLDQFLQAHAVLAGRLGSADFAELPNLLLLPPEQRERFGLILTRVGELQKTHMVAFVEARPVLIARLGLGGYAELMDRYAAAERQLNRAWSAAADGVYEEAVQALEVAGVLLDESLARLARPVA
jgi:hypothetical protein